MMAATLVLAVAKMVSFGTSPIPSISHAGSHLATWNTCHACCVDTDSGTLQNKASQQTMVGQQGPFNNIITAFDYDSILVLF